MTKALDEVFAPKELDERKAATHGNWQRDVEICHINGWKVGTRLIGDEGYGPEVIEITAIGREHLMAVCDQHGNEGNWTLSCRDWHPVDSAAGKWIASRSLVEKEGKR